MQIPTRQEVIKLEKHNNKKIVAVLPIYYPRPLLRAFDFHPMEIWGITEIDHSIGKRHFQAYTCAVALTATSFILGQQGQDLIDLLLMPHTCDTLQGMGSVFKDFIRPKQPILTFYAPKNKGDIARQFIIEELKRLTKELEKITGLILDEEKLLKEIYLEEQLHFTYKEISQNRHNYALSDREFYTFLRSWEYLPIETFLSLAKELPVGHHEPKEVKLLLSGIVPEPMELFDHINEMGASVVADDLACCSRRIFHELSHHDDENQPFERLATMLMNVRPAPTLGTPILDRVEYLKEKMQQNQAQGFLMYDIKFCEPELFDLPILRKKLLEAGYSFLHVESELDKNISHQNLTRIEAFVESLS